MSVEIDDVDQEIIEHLRENARATYVDIGKALGISDATVYNRVTRLMEIGVIKRFTVEIDESVLQKRTEGFVELTVKPGAIVDVSEQLIGVDGVKEVHEVHGARDLILKIEAEDLDRLRSVILRVRKVPHVVQTEFIPVFKTWKD